MYMHMSTHQPQTNVHIKTFLIKILIRHNNTISPCNHSIATTFGQVLRQAIHSYGITSIIPDQAYNRSGSKCNCLSEQKINKEWKKHRLLLNAHRWLSVIALHIFNFFFVFSWSKH